MYIPAAFVEDDLSVIHSIMHTVRLANLVTTTVDGLISTPLPLLLVPEEGEFGTLYGHIARANKQWTLPPAAEALAIFMGADAYVSPSWYPSKQEHHKVVPTWNYVAVHAYGPVEFFDSEERLLNVVVRLTNKHEQTRAQPWAVSDAPEAFIKSQLKGIVGIRLPISRLEGKRKLSQNRSMPDRQGVVNGLSQSQNQSDQEVAHLIPL